MAAVAPVLFPEMKRRGSQRRRAGVAALGLRRDERDHPAQPGADHHRLGDRRVDRRAVHRRPAARPGAGDRAGPRRLVALARRERSASARPRREIGRTFVIALPALLLPFVIRSAVVEGVATATEVSTIGIAYATVCGLLIYRQFDWRRLYPMLVETACAVGRDPADHRHGDRHGLGADPVGLLAPARAGDGERAGRQLRLPDDLDRGLRGAGQRAGGHPGDRAVRAAAVPDRQGRARATRCTMRWW